MEKLFFVKTSVGWCGVLTNRYGYIVASSLPKKTKKEVVEDIKKKTKTPFKIKSNKNQFSELVDYFNGRNVEFNWKISFDGFTDFEKKVLKEVQKIKYGTTITYKQLSQKIGHPLAFRAVGNALSKNKIPVIVPCHRVIREDKTLGKYSGGISWKYFLLDIEKN